MKTPVEYFDFLFTTKGMSVDDVGTFEGYLAVFGNEDLDGEVVQKGAFTKTLSEQNEFPLHWMHDLREPIGSFTAQQDDHGLYIKGMLVLDDAVPLARKAYALMKGRAIKGLSFGAQIIKYGWSGPRRILQELALKEGTVCSVMKNSQAGITAMKALGSEDSDAFFLALKGFIPTIVEEIDPTVDYWINMAAMMKQREIDALMEFRHSINSALDSVSSQILLYDEATKRTDDEKRTLFFDALRIHERYMMTWFDEVLSRANSDINKALSPSMPELLKTASTISSDEPHTADEPLPLPWDALATDLKLTRELWRIKNVQTL